MVEFSSFPQKSINILCKNLSWCLKKITKVFPKELINKTDRDSITWSGELNLVDIENTKKNEAKVKILFKTPK